MNAVPFEMGMAFRAAILTELGLSVNCCLHLLYRVLYGGVN